jgi:transcriptional regulator with XRE-family HTH domain
MSLPSAIVGRLDWTPTRDPIDTSNSYRSGRLLDGALTMQFNTNLELIENNSASSRVSRSGGTNLPAGERLKDLRNRLGITTREVEEYSRKIVEAENNEEFYVSNAWLTQIENKITVPSIYKLFALSVIYRIRFTDLVKLFGVDLDRISKYEIATPLPHTHLTNLEVYDSDRSVNFPVRFDPGFKPAKTNLLSRLVEIWGEVPISLIQHLDFRHCSYGYIGLEDYTLFPLLRPGSFVQIDDQQKKIQKFPWRNEFDRPIYFLELRDGYACGWCQLQGNQLILLPHPLSGNSVRQFAYPADAEIVGRVVGVAMRIVTPPEPSAAELPRLPS